MQAQMPVVEGVPSTLISLRYIDLKTGDGPPALAGQKYTVHYTGWLADGTKFDSSVDRNEPISFIQGRRQVITGWELGFEGMKTGGRRRLFIPYQLAYGEQGRGPIPARSELIFDVELLAVNAAPELSPAVDLLLPFLDLERRAIALSQSIPEEKFSSCQDALIHIAKLAGSKDTGTRERIAIVKDLAANLDEVRKQLQTARAGFLAADAEVLNQPSNKRGWYSALNVAIAEQLGRAETCAQVSAPAF
jgi:hypothetical protein